jgi:hypothetical protein
MQQHLIVAPGGMKSIRRMPFLSQKTDAMIIFPEMEILTFFFSSGGMRMASLQRLLLHLQSQWNPETHLLPVRKVIPLQAYGPRGLWEVKGGFTHTMPFPCRSPVMLRICLSESDFSRPWQGRGG